MKSNELNREMGARRTLLPLLQVISESLQLCRSLDILDSREALLLLKHIPYSVLGGSGVSETQCQH